MVIRESIEILRENTSLENFKKEIELLKSAGYKVFEESNHYVRFFQSTTVVDSDLIINKKMQVKI
jgi:biotin operon repressor